MRSLGVICATPISDIEPKPAKVIQNFIVVIIIDAVESPIVRISVKYQIVYIGKSNCA